MKKVWIHPTGNKVKVVILTSEALLLANPTPPCLKEFKDTLHGGQVSTTLLAESLQVIPLISVLRLHSERESPQIRIQHGFGGKPSSSLAQFDELETRDNAFEEIRRALGSGFSVSQRETGMLKSGWQPLAKAAAVAALALSLRSSAVQAASSPPGAGSSGASTWISPAAITLVAIGLISYFLRDFYRRTQKPSPLLELVRD